MKNEKNNWSVLAQRVLAFLLAIIMVWGVLPAGVVSATNTEQENIDPSVFVETDPGVEVEFIPAEETTAPTEATEPEACDHEDCIHEETAESADAVFMSADQIFAMLAIMAEDVKSLSGEEDELKAFHNDLMYIYVAAFDAYDNGLLTDEEIEEVDAKTVAIEELLMDLYGFDPYAEATTYGTYTCQNTYAISDTKKSPYTAYWVQYEGKWCAKTYSGDAWIYNSWVRSANGTYYFIDNGGYMLTGTHTIITGGKSKSYTFSSDGSFSLKGRYGPS